MNTLPRCFLPCRVVLQNDLAYQNLTLVNDLPEIKTACQITQELVRLGTVSETQADRLDQMIDPSSIALACILVDSLVLRRYPCANRSGQ